MTGFAFYATTQTQPLSALLKAAGNELWVFETVTVLAGAGAARELLFGTVLGKCTLGTITAAAVAGSTGNGTVASAVKKANCQLGAYTLVCTAAASNAGTFAVYDPKGNRLKDATVAVAYDNGQVGFTIGDGSTDFIVGDSFTLTVAAGDGKVVALDFAAVDGTQNAYGVLTAATTAPDGSDAPAIAIVADAILAVGRLAWPAGATTDQKAAALSQLKVARIMTRQEA